MNNTHTYIVHVETLRERWPMTCTRDITSWKVTATSENEAKNEALNLAWRANTGSQSAFRATVLMAREVAL